MGQALRCNLDTLTRSVNTCLRGAGLRPVATYNDTNLNAAVALESVRQASREIQERGWWFNEEKGWKLYPDSNGQIKVPNNTLDITSWNGSKDKSLTIRDGVVYNTLTHSNDLSADVGSGGYIEFIFIVELGYESLPSIAQSAITARAKRQYVQDNDGDVNKLKSNSADETRTYNELCSAESRNKKQNAMQNGTVASFLARVGGQNSGGYFGLFPEKERQQ